jgi:hypothetical protein
MGDFPDGDAFSYPSPAANRNDRIYYHADDYSAADRDPDAHSHLYPYPNQDNYTNGNLYQSANAQPHAHRDDITDEPLPTAS